MVEFTTALNSALVAEVAPLPANLRTAADIDTTIGTSTQAALDLKAPVANPTFTGTVAGITKSMVGLGNVDNTSDANKPISTATQAALDLKLTTTALDSTLAGKSAASDGVSSIFGLNAAGTGVVRLKPFVFNVRDEGATGDGTTDDTAAFTAAKTAGGLVFVPLPPTGYTFAADVAMGTNAYFLDPSATWDQLTDGGKLKISRARGTSITDGCNIWRFSDRVFIGNAAQSYAGIGSATDTGNSWLSDATVGPAYLATNAGALYLSGGNSTAIRNPPYGFVAAMKTSTVGQGAIGVGSAIVADMASQTGWGFIAELQRESGAGSVYGLEIGAKNKGNNATLTPNAQVSGVYGIWAAGGGDNAFGGSSANASTAAFVVLKNSHTWNSGIVFMKDALTGGEAMALSSEGTGGAHRLQWYNAAGNQVFLIRSTSTGSTSWRMDHEGNAVTFVAGSGRVLEIAAATSAVNGIIARAEATGTAPRIIATGTDTDIDLWFQAKGTGVIKFGTHTATADTAISGYITVKDDAGNTRKLAVIT